MKNAIMLILAMTAFQSCQKENFQPKASNVQETKEKRFVLELKSKDGKPVKVMRNGVAVSGNRFIIEQGDLFEAVSDSSKIEIHTSTEPCFSYISTGMYRITKYVVSERGGHELGLKYSDSLYHKGKHIIE